MAPEMKRILLNKEVLEVADDSLGLQAELATRNASHGSVLYTGGTSVWNKTLSDGSVAVAMLNTGDFGNIGTAFGDFNISFTAEAVGLRGCRRFTARDLFKGEDLLNGESISPAHRCKAREETGNEYIPWESSRKPRICQQQCFSNRTRRSKTSANFWVFRWPYAEHSIC